MSELVENFDDGNHVIVDNENLLNENNDVDNDDHNESEQDGGVKLSDSDESDDDSDSDIEYEEIDLTDNPLYQVLSTLFEDEEGNNLCTILKSLVKSVDANTNALHKLLKKKSKN
tara:strand:+ start:275 stop:619 length:345 start_codon:yes stop_codon:yes gene_type:complete